MINNQVFGAYFTKNGVCWLSKVNAEKKIGVAVLFYGMLKNTRKGIKNEQIACTKQYGVCKN